MSNVNQVVLAYSGGLDTSVILKWLQDSYHCEVVTLTADVGQGEELEPAREKVPHGAESSAGPLQPRRIIGSELTGGYVIPIRDLLACPWTCAK